MTSSPNDNVTDKINILTYNFFIRPPGINNNGNDYKDKRIDMFCHSALSFYDIVCFQEMFSFGSSRRQKVIDLAQQSGFPYFKASRIPCFVTGIDGGLLMLSRYPMVRTDELVFTSGVMSDRFSYKGCLYAKINIRDNFHFHIFTTHTQASYENDLPLSDVSVQARLKQFSEIRAFMDQNLVNKPAGEPVFFLGDLNVNGRVTKFENDNRSSNEYLAMYQILCEGSYESSNSTTLNEKSVSKSLVFKDLLKEKFGYHPITYGDFKEDGDGTAIAKEKVLTLKMDQLSCLSLDYIFLLDESKNKDNNNNSNNTLFKAEVANLHIEEMNNEIPTQDFPCTQLSDHYGVSAQILVKKL
ncbi:hypothetical protein K502DRAFT_323342 [Neoconidiobolus thromboides FSU 785]|nr:hypothetical protein K502DRAFT_323342 [Neoconidiobolus thromboides FSU 785]